MIRMETYIEAEDVISNYLRLERERSNAYSEFYEVLRLWKQDLFSKRNKLIEYLISISPDIINIPVTSAHLQVNGDYIVVARHLGMTSRRIAPSNLLQVKDQFFIPVKFKTYIKNQDDYPITFTLRDNETIYLSMTSFLESIQLVRNHTNSTP